MGEVGQLLVVSVSYRSTDQGFEAEVGISKNKTAMFRRQHPPQSDRSQDERGAQAVIPKWDIMKSNEAWAV
jgi:hypothetical protein